MLKNWTHVATAALLVAGAAAAAIAGGDEPKESVTYAKSWEAAIAEAKDLNVPMVVHSHGFY
jgi:hypothetical protein